MGRKFIEYLPCSGRIYSCRYCSAHLSCASDILSKHFHAKSGRAYLFHRCINTTARPPEERLMTTGMHTVSELHCVRCSFIVGWRYVKAYEASQQYKEGKVLLERACVTSVDVSPEGVQAEGPASDPEDDY